MTCLRSARTRPPHLTVCRRSQAEDPGHEELDESMPEPDVAPRGVAVPETPSDKDREAHELTPLSPRSCGAACAFEPKELTKVISAGQQVNVQRPNEWITCW